MLTEIRDRSSGWFAWIIAAIIIIPMAFFGIQQYATTEANPTLVEIGDFKIGQRDFQDRLQREQERLRQSNPQLADSGLLNGAFYKEQVLRGMINQNLTNYIADKYNYQVSDDYVNELIRDNPSFQTDGEFDQAVYQAITASRGRNGAALFRNELKTNARAQQVVSGYGESALVLPSEVRALLEMQTEKRSIDLISVRQADFKQAQQVSDSEIEEYYQANIDNYLQPDRMSVSYIELDKNSLAETIEVAEDDIQALYQDYTGSFVADETRATRHILLSTTGDQSEDEQKAKAENLVSDLKAGADFEALAKQYSNDPGSAANGGSLGDVERGQMVAEFEEATFSLDVGQISEPVKSQFGWHIIRVDAINATQPDSYDSLKPQLLMEEKDRIAEEVVIEQAEQLRNVLFEQSDSLEPAAQELGLTIRTTALFSQETGEGIAQNALVREAAFGEAVLEEGLNSELIEVADGVHVAMRKLNFAEAAPKSLSEVAEQVKDTLLDQKASAAAASAAVDLKDRASNAWRTLTEDDSISIESHTISMIDTNQTVPNEVIREVLVIQANSGLPKVTSVEAANGDVHIVRLNKVEPGDINSANAQIRNSTRSLLEQRNGDALYASYLESLSNDLAIEIDPEQL